MTKPNQSAKDAIKPPWLVKSRSLLEVFCQIMYGNAKTNKLFVGFWLNFFATVVMESRHNVKKIATSIQVCYCYVLFPFGAWRNIHLYSHKTFYCILWYLSTQRDFCSVGWITIMVEQICQLGTFICLHGTFIVYSPDNYFIIGVDN